VISNIFLGSYYEEFLNISLNVIRILEMDFKE
jgi:hypothetical protein